ncbi:MAG: M13 family metallopeptidase [archaeon]|nr:M13 family metallopeptidase [archaeon]
MIAAQEIGKINEPKIPRFSESYMDTSANPREEFYRYSSGEWIRTNEIPEDKSHWTAFDELHEWNLYLLRSILEEASKSSEQRESVKQLVGQFFQSAMNTQRIDELGFNPILNELMGTQKVAEGEDFSRFLAELRLGGVETFFSTYSTADKKNSSIYALYLDQGGLSLPDREYYLSDSFSEIRNAYRDHVMRMFILLGETEEESKKLSQNVFSLETELAKNSRARADLRDEEKNYNKISLTDLSTRLPSLHIPVFLESLGVPLIENVVIGQPEFLDAVGRIISEKPIEQLRTYLRWRVLHTYAPYLHSRVEKEDFDFFRRKLVGQQEPEARWKIATTVIDEFLGEALGKLYVEKHFPPEARTRMALMVDDIREVFRERLSRLPWMTEATKEQALVKFEKFTVKIGYPDHFRDYSSVAIDPDDYVGNVRRAAEFEVRRKANRVGKAVDKSEWYMSPPTVNAYYSPTENEIVFPAGILQPPYFDVSLDDAVNYGGIGGVIAHEVTHGYDDQGRKFDAQGNLRDWWTPDDEKEFVSRARAVVELYSSQEPLPGMHVNGELTLGENIADFGGVSLAFEALQRRLTKEPAKREKINGLTPEQRFFVAWAQIWRENIREQELRRRLTIDPHSPSRYRGTLPAINHPAFDKAFPTTIEGKETSNHKITVW